MRRTFADPILLILGVLLIAAGRYALVAFDALNQMIGRSAGTAGRAVVCALTGFVPCGVPLGYLGVGVGAILVALAIGLPPGPRSPQAVAGAGPAEPRTRRWVSELIVAAGVLAALGSALSIRTRPGTWPLLLWLATFLLPIPAMIMADRARGTPFGNPFPRRWEWLVLLGIVGLDLLLVGHDMTNWRWAGTPDEADFFGVAKSIAVGTSRRALLSEAGVFMFQPVLSSLYPALFMMIFGVNAFAWKLSSAFALAGALPFTYLCARELWNRRVAFMATVFFGSAQLAVGFSHYGYNNVQVYLIVAGAFGVLAWARTRQSLLGYYLGGCIAGVGFYTYYTARVVAPLLILMIWACDGFPLSRKVRAQTLALLLGLGLAILPVFSDLPTMLKNMQKLAVSPEQASTPAAAVTRVLQHWFLSLVHGLWYPGPHHFQANPIVDPISATCAVVGFWLCIGGWWRRRGNGAFLAPAYVIAAFLVGATSQHYRPPLTRLLFLAPLTALLAAVGADRLWRITEGKTRIRQRVIGAAAVVLVAVSVVWNVATVEYNVRYEHHGYGRGTTSELLRMVQQFPARCRIIFVEPKDVEDNWVAQVLDEYGIESRLNYQRGVDATTLTLLRTAAAPLVVFADLPPPELASIATVLAQRFPAGVWHESAPGEMWNLQYLDACSDRGSAS